jgi:hypothetical protein
MIKLLNTLVFLIAIFFNSETVLIASDSIKIWSEQVRLKKSDFLSAIKPNPNTNFVGTEENAIGAYGIRAYVQQDACKITIYIIPYINKYQSWMYPYDSIRGILKHEQIHFNITELVARKLRYEISSFQRNGINDISEYSVLINSFIKDSLLNFQAKFDKETLNGTKIQKQNEFSDYIDSELEKYKSYSTDLFEFSEEMIREIFRDN